MKSPFFLLLPFFTVFVYKIAFTIAYNTQINTSHASRNIEENATKSNCIRLVGKKQNTYEMQKTMHAFDLEIDVCLDEFKVNFMWIFQLHKIIVLLFIEIYVNKHKSWFSSATERIGPRQPNYTIKMTIKNVSLSFSFYIWYFFISASLAVVYLTTQILLVVIYLYLFSIQIMTLMMINW